MFGNKLDGLWRNRFTEGGSLRRRRKIIYIDKRYMPRSKYMPHQGEQECLRRRYGGNARRIREERMGNVWNDKAGRYEPRAA